MTSPGTSMDATAGEIQAQNTKDVTLSVVGVGDVPAGEKLPTLASGNSLNTPGLSVHQTGDLPDSWDIVRI